MADGVLSLGERGYGHLFWTDVHGGAPVFLTSGRAGQQVCVAPEAGVTVVLTASRDRYLSGAAGDNCEVLPEPVALAAAR